MQSRFTRAYYEPSTSTLMKFPFRKKSLTKNSIVAMLTTIFTVTAGVLLLRSTTNTIPSAHASSAPSLSMPKYTSPIPSPRSISSSKKSSSGQVTMRLQKRLSKSSSSSSKSSRRSSVSSSKSSGASSAVKKRPLRKPIFKKISTKKS